MDPAMINHRVPATTSPQALSQAHHQAMAPAAAVSRPQEMGILQLLVQMLVTASHREVVPPMASHRAMAQVVQKVTLQVLALALLTVQTQAQARAMASLRAMVSLQQTALVVVMASHQAQLRTPVMVSLLAVAQATIQVKEVVPALVQQVITALVKEQSPAAPVPALDRVAAVPLLLQPWLSTLAQHRTMLCLVWPWAYFQLSFSTWFSCCKTCLCQATVCRSLHGPGKWFRW